jgi:hypothetical protein
VKQLAGSVNLLRNTLKMLSVQKTRKQFKINKNNYATFRKREFRRSRGAPWVQSTVRPHSSTCCQQNSGNKTCAAAANEQHTWTTVRNVSAWWLKILAHSGKRCKRQDWWNGKRKERRSEWTPVNQIVQTSMFLMFSYVSNMAERRYSRPIRTDILRVTLRCFAI